jgi:hypothetical protein
MHINRFIVDNQSGWDYNYIYINLVVQQHVDYNNKPYYC